MYLHPEGLGGTPSLQWGRRYSRSSVGEVREESSSLGGVDSRSPSVPSGTGPFRPCIFGSVKSGCVSRSPIISKASTGDQIDSETT